MIAVVDARLAGDDRRRRHHDRGAVVSVNGSVNAAARTRTNKLATKYASIDQPTKPVDVRRGGRLVSQEGDADNAVVDERSADEQNEATNLPIAAAVPSLTVTDGEKKKRGG